MRTPSILSLSVSALVLTFGCDRSQESHRSQASGVPTAASAESSDAEALYITNGTAVMSANPYAKTTVSIFMKLLYGTAPNQRYSYRACTGTLLDSQFVLTAAHCLRDFPVDKGDEAVVIGSYVLFGANFDYPSLAPPAAAISVPHAAVANFIPFEGYDKNKPGVDDIGLVQFSGGIPDGYEQVSLSGMPPAIGTKINLLGYGVTSALGDDSGTLRSAATSVSGTAKTSFDFKAALPLGQGSNCFGDSGGPAYELFKGAISQAGVISGTYDDCRSSGNAVAVAFFIDWFKAKGAKPKLTADSFDPLIVNFWARIGQSTARNASPTHRLFAEDFIINRGGFAAYQDAILAEPLFTDSMRDFWSRIGQSFRATDPAHMAFARNIIKNGGSLSSYYDTILTEPLFANTVRDLWLRIGQSFRAEDPAHMAFARNVVKNGGSLSSYYDGLLAEPLLTDSVRDFWSRIDQSFRTADPAHMAFARSFIKNGGSLASYYDALLAEPLFISSVQDFWSRIGQSFRTQDPAHMAFARNVIKSGGSLASYREAILAEAPSAGHL